MKTNLKLSLVAVALASVGFSANAADVTSSLQKVSKQGITAVSQATFNTNTPEVSVVPGAAYSVGDNLVFTFSADSVSSAPLVVTSTGDFGVAGTQRQITLGRVGQTGTTVTYRVTELGTQPGNALDQDAPHGTLNFAFAFDKAKVAAAGAVNVTLVSKLNGSGTAFDEAGDEQSLTAKIFSVVDQYKIAAQTPINATIDVTAAGDDNRKVFVAGAVNTLTLRATADAAAWSRANTTTLSYVVKGDFSWAINPDTGFVAGTVTATCGGGAVTPVVTATQATINCAAVTNTNYDATLTLVPSAYDADVTKRPQLSQGSFSADGSIVYTGGAQQSASGLNAGAWGINGSVVHIPYMVYGAVGTKTFSQIINVANNGSAAGKVYADVWTTAADGKVTRLVNNKLVGTVAARGLYRAAGDIKSLVEGAQFKDGYVQMRLTTDVAADNVTVYSAYVDNSTSERAIVNNDSPVNVRGFSQLATGSSVSSLATTVGTLATTTQLTAARDAINDNVDDVDTNVNDLETTLCAAGTGTVDLSSIQNISVAAGDSTNTTTGAAAAALTLDICN